MQGQVTVPYTPIGGNNMNSRIMPLSITGSTVDNNLEGGQTLMYNVYWSLPGGIMNMGSTGTNPGLAWAYILGRDENNILYTDEMFCKYLSDNYNYEFDEQCNPSNPAQVSQIEQTINNLVYTYVKRVIANTGLQDGYDWATMNKTYQDCMRML